jgi:(p)ppGpp synthase/HD superfamily hydrolase
MDIPIPPFSLPGHPQHSDMTILLKTISFSAVRHSTQRRKDVEQSPYINHPIGVATILAFEGGVEDLETLQAAVLHDVLEDTETSVEEVCSSALCQPFHSKN